MGSRFVVTIQVENEPKLRVLLRHRSHVQVTYRLNDTSSLGAPIERVHRKHTREFKTTVARFVLRHHIHDVEVRQPRAVVLAPSSRARGGQGSPSVAGASRPTTLVCWTTSSGSSEGHVQLSPHASFSLPALDLNSHSLAHRTKLFRRKTTGGPGWNSARGTHPSTHIPGHLFYSSKKIDHRLCAKRILKISNLFN